MPNHSFKVGDIVIYKNDPKPRQLTHVHGIMVFYSSSWAPYHAMHCKDVRLASQKEMEAYVSGRLAT